MLFELHIKYKDGETSRPIIHSDNESGVKEFIRSEDILAFSFRQFKYRVKNHNLTPTFIVELGGKKYIYPNKIECHPKTTLSDVHIIKSIPPPSPTIKINTPSPTDNTFTFKSSSSDTTYTVKVVGGNFRCDCPGFFRALDRKCKHVKSLIK